MQLQQLEYFIAIADAGSLNKAAEKLYMTQPSLSKAIANLEAELNIRVFERSRNGVEMTEEGRKLYEYAKAIMERTDMIQKLGTQAREVPENLTLA
ncbi:MAG: LysR family transcriptional regulator, partial [Solobacterium sp.]|nr:LysR family transcriptional regulator [Solobacterium sp.]